MILYFSGTGNSRYVAERIGNAAGRETLDLFERIRSHDCSPLYSDTPWVIVVPTYAWRIPRIVEKWLENTPLKGNQGIYFVMTCGGDIGNAGAYLKKLCMTKKLEYLGTAGILMPENYIAMFPVPDRREALDIIGRAEEKIQEAALKIKNGEHFPEAPVTGRDRLVSGPVNVLFYPMFVHAGKFYAGDGCTSCGRCSQVCPLSNIRLEGGRPVWGRDCTHCMACIARCPAKVIEYGKKTRGKERYVCPVSHGEEGEI